MEGTPSVASDFVVAATLTSNMACGSGDARKTSCAADGEHPFSLPAFGIALNEAAKVREGE